MLKITLLFLVFTVVGVYGAPATKESNEWDWRIVGGSNGGIDAYPYQVSLRSVSDSHFCGGSIITTKTILTAAHCVVGRAAVNTIVVVGTDKLNSGGTRYQASEIRVHYRYNQNTLENDIALVIVNSGIALGGNVKAIDLGYNTIGAGVTATLTGWGTTSYPGSAPNNLQMIKLLTISVADCQSRMSSLGSVLNTQICTYTKSGEGACHGDSGGPLVADGNIIGIVSWGSPCARGYPDVYTRVSSYYTWINDNKV